MITKKIAAVENDQSVDDDDEFQMSMQKEKINNIATGKGLQR